MDLETLVVRKEGPVLFADIAAPPMNLLGPELVRDLVTLIQDAEADDTVQVLVFSSADPDYFISHVDLDRIAEYRAEAAKLTGEASIALLFHHLSASRLVTIAQIEGRVRAAARSSPSGTAGSTGHCPPTSSVASSERSRTASRASRQAATLRSRSASTRSRSHRWRTSAVIPTSSGGSCGRRKCKAESEALWSADCKPAMQK